MLIYGGAIIAGGGTIVLPMTRAEYEANKAVLDTADVWIDLTDEPDQVATADEIAYRVSNVQKGMGYIGDIATKAIAKVEPTDTALYLHEVGTPFINKDGNYCVTDVQIAVGGTITLGTNCHVVDGGISSDLTANTVGSGVTITSTPFTAPNDGYLRLYANDSGYVIVNLKVGGVTIQQVTHSALANATSFNSVFIKKGVQMDLAGLGGTANALYIQVVS